MTKDELEKATGMELIEQRNYCGVDGYYGDYILDVNAEMLKRFNRLTELELKMKHITEHIEPQVMTALLEQVEEEVEQEQRIEKMKSALERWYNQHSDKSYTETFYKQLIDDTEELLWSNCKK